MKPVKLRVEKQNHNSKQASLRVCAKQKKENPQICLFLYQTISEATILVAFRIYLLLYPIHCKHGGLDESNKAHAKRIGPFLYKFSNLSERERSDHEQQNHVVLCSRQA